MIEPNTGPRSVKSLVTVYTPESPLRQPRQFVRELISDLWGSRELAWRLFVRDLRAQYRASLLGYVWVFLPPLVASLPFVYLKSAGVISIGDTPIPYAAYAMVGAIIWQTFVDALNSPLRSVNAARAMLTRINFPREAILLSGLMQVGFTFVVRLALVIGVFAAFALKPAATSPLFVIGMISIALTGFMIGLVLTPLGVLYGDVQHSLPIASTFLMLITPVLYPVPSSGLGAMVASLNPLTPLITTTRDWLTAGAAVQHIAFLVVSGVTVTLLILAWVLYRLALPHLVARLGN
jgi:ABC-type polysaccharide/polyol phosphate export systems, permease component